MFLLVWLFKEISLWLEVSRPPRFKIQGGALWVNLMDIPLKLK